MFEVRLHDTDSSSNRHVCARSYMSVARKHCYKSCGFTLHQHHVHHHDYHDDDDDGLCHSKWSLSPSLLEYSSYYFFYTFSSHFLVIILNFFIGFDSFAFTARCRNVFSLRNIRPSPIMAASFSLSKTKDSSSRRRRCALEERFGPPRCETAG